MIRALDPRWRTDDCATRSSAAGPRLPSSSLMVFDHDATSTREHDQDPPRTHSDAS